MAALRAALLLARLLLGQLSLVPVWLSDAQAGQGFQLHQPQKISVMAGETLTLNCTVTAGGPIGPVKWLKGWGSGNETIYDQKGSSSRVTRAVNGSNTDFTILISDVRPEDDGTYYCVKYRKTPTGDDELYRRGEGTVVVVRGTSPFPSVEVATAVLFFLLLIFILIFCVYHKKCRGEGQSQGAAGAPAGGCSPIAIPCCAGSPGTPSDVRDAETPRPPQQQSSEQKDIHYADLQPLHEAPQRSQSPGTDRSEYASIRAAAK
ncbi:tyrosine-protein phosphatase non-receptor type substrate 1-like [Aythya fuligula]|uniref:Tyrosine-protein phosphatase non-receptor type substrate 1-like n=1 Tax=Aythya fuligula TaxID=219594 RepID=A0A6J3DX87_AYTFU|nr:tyrosine-protein phosphatase non-receptor type substrate 1-like [Aythya fuligula]